MMVATAGMVATFFTVASVQEGEHALRWWPVMSSAQAEAASDLLVGGTGDRAAVARSRALADRALRTSPINVEAVRTWGLAAAITKDEAGAARTFTYALQLSRRDIPTQMWFIERAVARDDIDGALRHYDQAMTTSVSSRQMLIPVLVGATATPAINDRLIPLLRGKPNWWGGFVHQLIGTSPDAGGLYRFARELGLRTSDTEHPDFLPRIVERLVTAGQFNRAFDLYRSDSGTGKQALRNGGFELSDPLPPLDWRYVDDADLSGVRQSRPDGRGSALFLLARAGRGGAVAEQLVQLGPGRYRLTLAVGSVPAGTAAERPRIVLRCEGSDRQPLDEFVLPTAPEIGIAFVADFTIAGTCTTQRLIVEARSPLSETADITPWIDDIAIGPVRG